MEAAVPQSEFEAYALGILIDGLKSIPAAEASATKDLTLELTFEQDNHEQPQIQAQWNMPDVADPFLTGSLAKSPEHYPAMSTRPTTSIMV